MTPFLPKEHGAYGQMAFPLVTAFLVAGLSAAGSLLAIAIVAGFLLHEPAAVVLGQRGVRATRELQRPALRWIAACAAVVVIAGIGALTTIAAPERWTLVVPLVPAVLLAVFMVRGREKSWYGELAAALAFSGTAVPIAMAAGATLRTALTVAIPFALLFTASTLAVRVVILRVRGGGNPRAAAATRCAALAVAGLSAAALTLAISADLLTGAVLLAAAPGLLTAAAVAVHPPSPAHLRTLGWTLVAVSVLTVVVIAVSA